MTDSKELIERLLSLVNDLRRHTHPMDAASTVFSAFQRIASLEARVEALEGERDALQKKFGLAWHVLVYVEAASECSDSRADAKAAMKEIEAVDAPGDDHAG